MAVVTIPDTDTIKTVVIGAGGALSFTFDFSFFADTDLVVFARDDAAATPAFVTWELGTNYTVTGNSGAEGGFEGGTITFVAGALANYTFVVQLNIPLERTTNLPGTGPFPVDSLNVQLSKLVAMHRQQKELIDRVVSVAVTDTGNVVLPDAATRANGALTFDASGNATATALTAFPTATLTAIGTAVGTASTEADARDAIDAAANQGVVTSSAATLALAAGDEGKTYNLESGAGTITLPAAATAGNGWFVHVLNNSGSAVTVDPDASELVDGGATASLVDGSDVRLVTDGSEWYVDGGGGSTAADTTFDNTVSGLSGANVKAALDELTQRIPRGNAVLNESMMLWREGESGRGTFASGTWFADMWEWVQNGTSAAVTVVKDTTTLTGPSVAGYAPSGLAEVQVTTADASLAAGDHALVRTFVEGYDATALRQKKLKLRFVTAHNRTGTYTVTLSNSGYDRQIVLEYTQSVADTAELHEFEIPVSPSAGTWDTTNGVGFYLTFTLASGATQEIAGATGSWLNETAKWTTSNQVNGVAATSDRFRFGCVRLVPADHDVNEADVQPRSLTEELDFVNRYFYSDLSVDGSNSGVALFRAPGAVSSGSIFFWYQYPKIMRAAATVTNPNASLTSASSFSVFNSRPHGTELSCTVTGAGGYLQTNLRADARP